MYYSLLVLTRAHHHPPPAQPLDSRPDLKIVIMSATIDAERFSDYFGGCVHPARLPTRPRQAARPPLLFSSTHPSGLLNVCPDSMQKAPVITVPGRLHPVTELYLDDFGPRLGVPVGTARGQTAVDEIIQEEGGPKFWVPLLKHVCSAHREGAVLCFLSGWNEIRTLLRALEADSFFDSRTYKLLPLHSRVPYEDQLVIFDRPPPGMRKIILVRGEGGGVIVTRACE